jgi:hypothetical protein
MELGLEAIAIIILREIILRLSYHIRLIACMSTFFIARNYLSSRHSVKYFIRARKKNEKLKMIHESIDC